MSSPSISPSPSFTTVSATTPSSSGSGNGGDAAPATATLLFGFLVIFAALFAAFLLLAFFWKIQQRRQTAFLPEFDDRGGSNRGVPKLWEVWIRDRSNEKEWDWENENTTTTPLSVDVDRDPSNQITTLSPQSRSRRPWPCSPFRRRPVRPRAPQAAQQPQPQVDVHGVAGAEEAMGTGLISSARVSFVIAMPHAEIPYQRRSEISQVSQVVELQRNWRRREYAIGIYHPSFREGWTL